MKTEAERLAAREEIDLRLATLENFAFGPDVAITDEEIDALTNLLCSFHTGQETKARFATIAQIERAKLALPTILGQHIPRVVEGYFESDSARSLIDCDLPMFLTSIAKLDRARAQQSASGRGAFGRDTVENTRLAQENAELRQAKEPVAESEPEDEAA
jgi:hypothetical protein